MMNKDDLIRSIIAQLSHDLDVLFTAAKTAHEAATHEENQPDNEYDTLALEASYVAQGQANRAQEMRRSLEIYRQLQPLVQQGDTIRMASLVTLEDVEGATRQVFIGPAEGGLKIVSHEKEIVVITPGSPLGKALLGRTIGDAVEIETSTSSTEYEIVEVR
jgi:transcription elongation GreA/GreB family factor